MRYIPTPEDNGEDLGKYTIVDSKETWEEEQEEEEYDQDRSWNENDEEEEGKENKNSHNSSMKKEDTNINVNEVWTVDFSKWTLNPEGQNEQK